MTAPQSRAWNLSTKEKLSLALRGQWVTAVALAGRIGCTPSTATSWLHELVKEGVAESRTGLADHGRALEWRKKQRAP